MRSWFALGFCCWLLLIFFHQRHYDSPTPVSRLDLIMAICLEHRLEIDSFEKNTPDKARINGHYYSDKAPGTVVLALIGSAPAIWIGQALGWTVQDKKLWLAASWAGCAVLDIPLAAGFVCLVRLLLGILGSETATQRHSDAAEEKNQRLVTSSSDGLKEIRVALAAVVFVIFGGMAWPYATMMFSHAQAIGCIAIGLWCLYRAGPGVFSLDSNHESHEGHEAGGGALINSRSGASRFWAGFAFGWALNSEYTTGLIVFGVPLILFWGKWRNWLPFLAGLGGPCLLIPVYSWATIGVPWRLPYSYQASFPEMKKGLYAIQWPDTTVAFSLLFSPERGLLFWCPFLAIAFFGYAGAFRANGRLFLITYLLPILQVAVISGRVWDWPAGPTFSARYLAPMIPLLAIPCAFGLQRIRWLGYILGVVALLLTAIAATTDAAPSFNAYSNPLLDLNWPLVVALNFNRNLLSAFFVFSLPLRLLLLTLAFVTMSYVTCLRPQKRHF